MKFIDIDHFAPNQVEKHNRTYVGSCATVLAPILLGLYMAKYFIDSSKLPPVIVTSTNSAAEMIFDKQSFQCIADECYVTFNYAGPTSQKCKELIEANQERARFLNKCTVMSKNAIEKFPLCYTSDPIDGLSVVWKRPAVTTGSNIIRHGMVAKQAFFKDRKWQTLDVPLFPGIHVFQMSEINETLSNPSQETTEHQAATVQVSEESWIDNTNLCCSKLSGATCASGANPGTANDYATIENGNVKYVAGGYYQIKIRTFPTYQSISMEDRDLFNTVVTAAGSFFSLMMLGLSALVAFYRFAAGTDALKELTGSRSVMSSSPAVNDKQSNITAPNVVRPMRTHEMV